MTLLTILAFSSSWWAALGVPLANHLWQSTVFAGVAALLTLMLRKNHAQARYLVWLTASVKFLVPFSLLVSVGSHLGSSKTPAVTQPAFFVMQAISQPFAPTKPSYTPAPAVRVGPTLLLFVWFGGCVTVLAFWWLRWRRMTTAIRSAMPVQNGRELEALHRLERSAGIAKHIGFIIAQSAVEPGILGIFRPVLFLPERITDRLTDSQLEAILTHELCHVRRRDNLAAAVHMLVEAVFWFHPLVWWIGTRLVDERERACDEEVLSLGSDPQVYAEGILKVCKFYVESPLFCAAGVTGSNLKKRIEAIMMNRITPNLELGKKLLIATIGVAAIVGPVAFGLVQVTQSKAEAQAQNAHSVALAFDSVSIKLNKTGEPMAGFIVKGRPMRAVQFKPDRFMATNFTLHGLIQLGYRVQDSQISGGPDWLDSEKYDIEAKLGNAAVDELSKLTPHERNQEHLRMIQALLADRFNLALHRETREVPGYALVVVKDGPKLHEAAPGDTYANGFKDPHGHPLGAGVLLQPGPCKLVGQGVPIADLVRDLSQQLSSSIVDETGLKGNYDFTLDCHTAFMERGSSLLTVLPEQLGLELNAQTVPLEVLVIDHAEQVTADESSETQPQDPSVAESLAPSMPPPLVYEAVLVKPDKSPATPMPTRNFPPDGFTATNVTLQSLIEWAYNVEGFQISGAPSWVNNERYDVQAKVDSSIADELRGLSEEQRGAQQQPMLLELLADHFKLEVHREIREVPVYELVVAGNGPKLRQANTGESSLLRCGKGLITGQSVPIASLVRELSFHLQRPVLDKTGLEGTHDFSLEWTAPAWQGVEHGPSIFVAVQEQLGFKLLQSNDQAAPIQMLVIDHAEKPSEN